MQEVVNKILARLIKENESGIKSKATVPGVKTKSKKSKIAKTKSKLKKRSNRMIIFLLLIVVLASASLIIGN